MSVPVTVQRALSVAARRYAKKTALRYQGRGLTYADLDARACRLAKELEALGVRPSDRVGVMLSNSPDYVVVALACAKATFCMVPINYHFTGNEVARQLEDCAATALIYSPQFSATLTSAALAPNLYR